jgi:hypothetical protein
MRIAALAVLAIGVVWAAAPARAQTYDPAYPVCMYVVSPLGGGYQDCSYYALEQCRVSASGRGAQCSINPYYVGTRTPQHIERRHRRAY